MFFFSRHTSMQLLKMSPRTLQWQQEPCMQPYPNQSQLSKWTHILIKIVSIGPPHMESPTGFSQAPLKWHFPKFHNRMSSFCYLPIFSLLEPSKVPPKGKQDFNRFWEASPRTTFPFQRKFPLLEITPFSPCTETYPTVKVHAVSIDPDVPH